MRTRTYSNGLREFAALADAMNRNFGVYDYARNGGSNGESKFNLPVDIWTSENAFHIARFVGRHQAGGRAYPRRGWDARRKRAIAGCHAGHLPARAHPGDL